MASDERRIKVRRSRAARQALFDEAPGEAGADAVRDAFLSDGDLRPERQAAGLALADPATRVRVINGLQQRGGNAYVQRVVAAGHAAGLAVQRQGGKGQKKVPAATTAVGPVKNETYDVEGANLQKVVDAMSGRDEAGECNWAPEMNYSLDEDGKITRATVKVPITVTLPNWKPPKGTGPKTKAEWQRARTALKVHEEGHAKLVHQYFDDFAKKIIGKTSDEARTLLQETGDALQKASDGFDTQTDHGKKTGTVIDTSIKD